MQRGFCSGKLLEHSCPKIQWEVLPCISKVITKTHLLIVTPVALVALFPVLCFCWQNLVTSPKSLIFASILHSLGSWNAWRVGNEHFGRAVLACQLCGIQSCLSLQPLQKLAGTNFTWITISQQTGLCRWHKEGKRGSPVWISLFSCQSTTEKLYIKSWQCLPLLSWVLS